MTKYVGGGEGWVSAPKVSVLLSDSARKPITPQARKRHEKYNLVGERLKSSMRWLADW